ncbi:MULTISPECIES: putative bifunctional diguanylate cyclase/phosphodiesterase [unclassified Sphingomonas]|jgi:diguanylate cyclase (GGDEF)-like protein|uniref:putative bifunctional diguanylate cyclase/phosphodiesterase n=1 Tax=Sphingomonas sp. PvP015 TaxID=3156388 RepID=UPI003390EF1D
MTRLISRLRQLRHSDQAVDANVRAVLVTSLYASPKSLVIGALTSSSIAAVVAVTSKDAWLVVFAILIAAVAAIRIVGVIRPSAFSPLSRTPVDRGAEGVAGRSVWERYYRLGAYAFSTLLGLFGMLTLIRTEDGVLHLLAVTTAIGYAAGIAGRNAGRPWIALAQLCLASLPLPLGLILSGNWLNAVLAIVILLFVFAMMDITLQTYDAILKATLAASEKTALAEHHAAFARRDDLTGVANRTAFRERFEQILRLRDDTGGLVSIHWIDLDRFKEINDSLGHLAGNALLVGIAHRLETAFALTGGIVARLGGDEFAVVSRIDAQDEAAAIGDRILDLIAKPVAYHGQHLAVGASLGVAIAPTDGVDADTLLKNADLALYRAKEGGRGTLCFYEPVMDEKIEYVRSLAAELQGALARGEFHLAFQPIFDLATHRIRSCETLLRWNSRVHGNVSPAEFIPIAEQSGLIVEIGGWVLREACRQAREWPSSVRVAVNLSPIQLLSPGLPGVIMGSLGASGLAADRLDLEVTESVLLADIDASLEALKAINRMGVATTLDDFGTGYSSLSYLTKFPFQTLKIDRSFIAALDDNPASMAIVQTVVDLAATLGMRTVAEGIETPAQLAQLRRTRCTAVQGFLLARPMSASMVATLLADDVPRMRAVP